MACPTLPPRFKQSFAFQPFRFFHHLFRDNSNSISLRFGLPVYKCSPVYPTLVRRRMILDWQTTWSKRLNEGMLILSDLALLALPYVATITAISRFPEYRLYYAHKIVQWPCGKVICHIVKYTRDH